MILAGLVLAIAQSVPRTQTLDQVLDAIEAVETSGRRGSRAIGDGGRSIGPFQIQREYWIDSGVPGRFEDCFDTEYARRVVKAYWLRWCPKALESVDCETLARIHNGGPKGMEKASTLRFWKKVSAKLQSRAIPAAVAGTKRLRTSS